VLDRDNPRDEKPQILQHAKQPHPYMEHWECNNWLEATAQPTSDIFFSQALC